MEELNKHHFHFWLGLYRAWWIHSFGMGFIVLPVPNPFYKKGGSGLHLDLFKNSLLNVLRLCLPVLFAFVLGFRSRETAKAAHFHI